MLIRDHWHAAEYLTELAQVLHPHDEAQRQHVLHDWRHRLKYEGGQRLIDLLAALPLPRKNAAVQTKHAEALQYFRNNVHRMDYPRYLIDGKLKNEERVMRN